MQVNKRSKSHSVANAKHSQILTYRIYCWFACGCKPWDRGICHKFCAAWFLGNPFLWGLHCQRVLKADWLKKKDPKINVYEIFVSKFTYIKYQVTCMQGKADIDQKSQRETVNDNPQGMCFHLLLFLRWGFSAKWNTDDVECCTLSAFLLLCPCKLSLITWHLAYTLESDVNNKRRQYILQNIIPRA